MQIKDFPRPRNDNGLGIHLFPHPYVTGDAPDPWIQKMVAMKLKWTTTLNCDLPSLRKFAAAGIQPVCRPFYRANSDWGDDHAVVENMLAAGVGPYVQIYNEPELDVEWPGGTVDENAYITRWIGAAENIFSRGGLPGIQLLDPDWLHDLLNAIKGAGKEYLFEKVWFACHNYTSNHPPSYPYDSLNPGKTIYDDWFAMLSPLKFDKVFRDTIGRSVPVICGEGGWCIGDNADNRYGRVGYDLHRDYHVAMFDMFRTGVMPMPAAYPNQGLEPLPDWWFAVTPWLLASQLVGGDMQFEENAWYSENLSGTKTLTIEAIKAIPTFVRRSASQRPEPRQSAIRGTVFQGTPGQTVLLGGAMNASTKTDIRNRFAFLKLPSGTYTLEIEGTGIRVEGVKADGMSSAVVNLSAVLQTWAGKVVSNTSGTVPRGSSSILRVSVIGIKDLLVKISAWGISISNRTGTKPEYGEYACEFAPLPAGTWVVEPDGIGARVSVPLDGAGVAVVDFTKGSQLAAPPAVSIVKGAVVNGKEGARVVLICGDSAEGITVKADLAYEFGELPAGTYSLEAEGTNTRIDNILLDGTNQLVVNLVMGSGPGAKQGAIGGAVVNGKAGMVVELRQPEEVIATTRIDDKGRFRFANLAAGTYRVSVAGTAVLSEPIKLSGKESVSVTLTLPRAGGRKQSEISGQVIPAARGAVVGLTMDGRRVAVRTMESDGLYRFEGLAGGTYTVGLLGTEVRSKPVAVDGSNKVEIDLQAPTPTAKVIGHYVLFWQTRDDWAKEEWAAAAGYIASFRPTTGFSHDDASYAKYVTVIGGVKGVGEEVESRLRWLGAKVERIAGKNSAEIGSILNEMVAKGRRFLTFDE